MLFGKTLLFLKLVFLFYPLSILFQTLQNFTWPNSSCDFIACELIKYNGFQISYNNPDEIPCLLLEITILKSKL